MKVGILLVFVLSVHLVFGDDTCSLTCRDEAAAKLNIANCEDYTFRVTSTRLMFDEARGECYQMGGDLLQANFGPDGAKYHSEIYQLAMNAIKAYDTEAGLWIGYSDRTREGTWRFLDGKVYDASNHGQKAVAYWNKDQPDNDDGHYSQNCARLWRNYGPLELDDAHCKHDNIITYGLCEIKTNKCRS